MGDLSFGRKKRNNASMIVEVFRPCGVENPADPCNGWFSFERVVKSKALLGEGIVLRLSCGNPQTVEGSLAEHHRLLGGWYLKKAGAASLVGRNMRIRCKICSRKVLVILNR